MSPKLEDFETEGGEEVLEVVDKKTGRKYNRPNYSRYRNLKQFQDLSEDEIFEKMEFKKNTTRIDEQFEKRIQELTKNFSEDYDLEDMNYNDRLVLRSLIQAMLNLEDLEFIYNQVKEQLGVTPETMKLLEANSRMRNELRKDISNLQADLSITRKIRKNDKNQTAIDFIEELKKKAKEFYSQKMSYVYCPKCNTLLGTFWTLYPKDERNKIVLHCNAHLGDDEICNTKVVVYTKDLYNSNGTNNPDTPESLK